MSSVLLASPGERTDDRPFPPKRGRRWLRWIPVLWVSSGIYLVQPDQQALVTTFNAVTASHVGPGLHYALPWPIDRVYKVKVRQLRRAVVGADVADAVLGRLQPVSSQFLTGDQNLINARLVVQYFVSDAKAFLFNTDDVDREVAGVVESEFARRMAHTPVDDILTTQKAAVQNEVLERSQRVLDNYNAGVDISSVSVETVTPPAETADAFRDVAGARADANRIISEAQGYANDLLPRARGEAAQISEAAQAYKDGKTNRASGDAARFDAVATEYAKAPSLTATRAYMEAMEQILPRLKKLIIDSQQNIDLTVIGRDGSQPK